MFTVEEITLMKMYSGFTPDRQSIINKLKAVVPHFADNEQEIKELTSGVIRKLTAMNDKSFESLDFSIALDEEAPQEA